MIAMNQEDMNEILEEEYPLIRWKLDVCINQEFCTQETFLMVIRKIGHFKMGVDGGLRAWVFRIATHLSFDVLRREKRILFSVDPDQELDRISLDLNPEQELEAQQFQGELQQALKELTVAQRMIFLLREQEDMSCLEISRVCGCSENAVRQGLFRARTALRRRLCD